MSDFDLVQEKKQQQSQLGVYFLPVIGIIPSLWTIYRGKAGKEQQKASRLSLMLILMWSTAYIALFVSATNASETLAFRLLYTNALITTGYFLISIVLMFSLLRGKSPYLPLVNQLINLIMDKKTS